MRSWDSRLPLTAKTNNASVNSQRSHCRGRRQGRRCGRGRGRGRGRELGLIAQLLLVGMQRGLQMDKWTNGQSLATLQRVGSNNNNNSYNNKCLVYTTK